MRFLHVPSVVARKYRESQIPAMSAPPGGDYQTNFPRVIRFEGCFVGTLGPIIGHFCNIMWCRAALQLLALPAPPRTSRSAAPRLMPCCSLHVAPCCPARRALLQPARRALLRCELRPAAASASRSAALRVAPCCSQRVALCCPSRRALLPCSARALLHCPPRALCPAATTTAAEVAARATVAAGGGAAKSARSAAGARGAGGAIGSAGGAAGAGRATGSAGGAVGAGATVTASPGEQRVGFHLSSSGLHLPTFSTNLASNAAIQDVWVGTFNPGGKRVAICKCSRTGHHLATFTRRPGSSLYTLTTASSQVAESSQVSASCQLAASCSCRILSHQTLLWHHCVGHPSLPRLRGMHSRLLVSRLPRSLPSLPRSPTPPCHPYLEGRQRAAPHSSEFPPTTAPLQTLHMDVWGPARADVSGVLIPWIRDIRRQLRERFRQDFPVMHLHSDKGETSPTLRWTGKVGNASVFRVWGALSLVRDAKASKLSSRTLRCVFLGFPTDAPPWKFYHARSHRVFSSQDVTFDESVYTLSPQGPSPSGVSQADPPLLIEPLEVSSDSSGPAEGGDPAADDTLAAVDSGAETAGAEPWGAETEGEGSGGAATWGAATWGAVTGGAGSRGAATGGAGSWGAATRGADSGGPAISSNPGGGGYGPAGAGAARPGGTASAGGTGGTAGGAGGAASAGGTRGAAGAGGAGATSPRGATGAGGAGPTGPGGGAGGAGGAAGARGTGAGGTGGAGGACQNIIACQFV
ncbi:unnamed protein product [Closterium sp. NIES-53]